MLRLSKTMHACRIILFSQDIRPLNCCTLKETILPAVGKLKSHAKYSTAQQQKIKEESFVTARKTIKARLRAKPYEELLKVLEVRERNLENKKFTVSSVSFENDSQPQARHIFKNETENSLIVVNDTNNEGPFTVKKSSKSKKKKSSKSQTTDEGKSKTPPKNTKKKAPLSVKQHDVKRNTNYTYALSALKCYMEVNINANEVEKAQEYLMKQLGHFKKKYQIKSLEDVDLYNLLISGWAQRGKLDKVKQVFNLMSEDGIVPNLQSYAGYLECIARSDFIDVSEVDLVVEGMKSKELTHRDILQKCVFRGDQQEKVMQALAFSDVKLSSEPTTLTEAYVCKLLQPLNDKSYEKGDIYPDFCVKESDIHNISSSQLEVEDSYSLKIKSVDAMSKISNKTLKSRNYLNECEDTWRKTLTAALKNLKNYEWKCHRRGYHKEESIHPYISVIDNDIIVNLLLQEIRMLAETGEFFSPNDKYLYRCLGSKVMNHYFIWLNRKNKVTDKVLFIYQKYLSYLSDTKLLSEYSPREYWEHLKKEHSSGPTIDVANTPWPHGVLIKIGCELYDILQKNIAFNSNLVCHKSSSKVMTQAFYVTYEDGHDVKISKHIRTHHLLCKLYRDANLEHLEFDTTLVPMLSPPKPWVKCESGGLLITPTPFIRLNNTAVCQTMQYTKVPSQELYPCFDSLNSLSLCPWIINKPVLDLVTDVFQKGGNEELDIPLNPNSLPAGPKVMSCMSKKEKAIVWRQKKELKKNKCETSSLWFDCLYKLSIANHFRDKVFWFPHNLDFRGRVYPTPPHFNHLGSDMARSILLFAEGKPLGKNGLDWLKIQLINLTGFKKRDPIRERLKYANEMISEIFDSADRPFEGNQWWKMSDKPWQTLACCKEVANAMRHSNPEEYVSHFPIHQDGSCNGLQHYAALGRDELGAIEVNLQPSDAPHDVYSGVSALVERERQKDAANGVEVAQVLEGFVRRKVVKQTVMTFVYGVTKYGAKLQILKQLKNIPEFPEKYYHEAAVYLMKKIFFSIKEMFTTTQEIQDWFTDCAEQITRVSGDTLEWVTPLGLPVIQPYHKEITLRSSNYSLPMGNESCLVYTSHNEPYQLPNIRKQKNGFAPNFIHSLDASHMMLTSLFCQRRGFTFVSVHDCYWTHAATVEIMNKICRDQFVALHKEPILEKLSTFFLDKYARVANENIQVNKSKQNSARLKLRDIVSTVPQKGVFNLDKVLESEYFFS